MQNATKRCGDIVARPADLHVTLGQRFCLHFAFCILNYNEFT